ncbi:zinc-containing alcohol dehydrogenase family protein [Pleurotus pulmonarius]
MKAARYYGPGKIVVEDIPEPTAERSQIKIKVAWNGICGTDLHCFLMRFPKSPTPSNPNEISGETLPVTIGHEFSGTIVALGEDVDVERYRVGDAVVVEPVFSCLKSSCEYCTAGTHNLCPLVNCIGIGGFGGGLAEYIAVNQSQVHLLPANVSRAMIEPLAVAWYAVKRSKYVSGCRTLVVGAGPIGLLTLAAIKAIDPSGTVFVSEPAALRRTLATKQRATMVINPLEDDVWARISESTSGKGVDIVFDAAGVQASMDVGLKCLRPRGSLIVVASWETPPKVDMNTVLIKELVITATNTYSGIHPELLDAVAAGKFHHLDELITKKILLKDVVEEGIKTLLSEKGSQVKVLVSPAS